MSRHRRHRARHAAPVRRWPFWRTLALCVAVFATAFIVGTLVQLQPAGYARPAPAASTSQTTGE